MNKKNNILVLFIILFSFLLGGGGEFDGWGNTILHHVADSDVKYQEDTGTDSCFDEKENGNGECLKEGDAIVWSESNLDPNGDNCYCTDECNDSKKHGEPYDEIIECEKCQCVGTEKNGIMDSNPIGHDFAPITKHVIMLLIAAATTMILALLATKKYRDNVNAKPSGLSQIFEILMDFINKEIVIPNIGEKYSRTWTPVAMTFFVFILVCNLLGLIPFFEFIKWGGGGGSTPTGNFSVTVALAIITFFMIIIAGIKKHGFVGHWKNMVPSDVPKPVLIILIPIEIIGMIVKPFALTMRLGANMTAGHIGMVAIFALPIILGNGIQDGQSYTYLSNPEPLSYTTGLFAGFVAVLLNTGIYGLELIVSLVQAYVFTLLSCVFIGMAIHADH